MKIIVTNNEGTRIKTILRNDIGKNVFTDLTYTTSLQGIGSCSFRMPPKELNEVLGKNYFDLIAKDIVGNERFFIENDDGEIVYGGLYTGMNASIDGVSFDSTELKLYFKKLTSPYTEFSGNALQSIKKVLKDSNSSILLHENSDVVDDANVKLGEGASVYDAIHALITASYSRWILVHERVGNAVVTKLLVRSSIGVTPEGVGLDRSRDSDEVPDDEKVYFIYDEKNPSRSNILSYNMSIDNMSAVSKCTVRFKENGVAKSVTNEPYTYEMYKSGLINPQDVENFYGVNEKVINTNVITSTEQAQAIANREITFAEQRLSLSTYPVKNDDLFVGDRVNFHIVSGAFISINVDENFNIIVGTAKYRIEEKTVSYRDGYLDIRYTLSSRNALPYTYKVTEKISNIDSSTRRLTSDSIN